MSIKISPCKNEKIMLWLQFRKEWTMQKLQNMTINEYADFCHQVVYEMRPMGGISGLFSYNYGIYRYNNIPQGQGVAHDSRYAWQCRFGATADEAFRKVRGIVVSIAQLSAQGDLPGIDAIRFGGNNFKWKIAFLFQNLNEVRQVNIFSRNSLEFLSRAQICRDYPAMYEIIYKEHFQRDADMDGDEFIRIAESLWLKWANR